MTRTVWRSVNGRSALEYVTSVRGPVPARPWLPVWQRVAWWLVAAFLFVAMSCTFGRGW